MPSPALSQSSPGRVPAFNRPRAAIDMPRMMMMMMRMPVRNLLAGQVVKRMRLLPVECDVGGCLGRRSADRCPSAASRVAVSLWPQVALTEAGG